MSATAKRPAAKKPPAKSPAAKSEPCRALVIAEKLLADLKRLRTLAEGMLPERVFLDGAIENMEQAQAGFESRCKRN